MPIWQTSGQTPYPHPTPHKLSPHTTMITDGSEQSPHKTQGMDHDMVATSCRLKLPHLTLILI